jgi:hypothetical protein
MEMAEQVLLQGVGVSPHARGVTSAQAGLTPQEGVEARRQAGGPEGYVSSLLVSWKAEDGARKDAKEAPNRGGRSRAGA